MTDIPMADESNIFEAGLAAAREELARPLRFTEQMAWAMSDTISQLERGWFPQSDVVGTQGTYGYISYPLPKFLEGLRFADDLLRKEGVTLRRFMEIGCAWGTKMMLAHWMGWELEGIEFVPEYTEKARELFAERPDIVKRIRTADVSEVTGFYELDLIYMYRPLVDDGDMERLIQRIVHRIDFGTILFTPECPIPKGYQVLDEALSIWRV